MKNLVGELMIRGEYGYLYSLGIKASVNIDELKPNIEHLKNGISPQEYFENPIRKAILSIQDIINLDDMEKEYGSRELELNFHIENGEDE